MFDIMPLRKIAIVINIRAETVAVVGMGDTTLKPKKNYKKRKQELIANVDLFTTYLWMTNVITCRKSGFLHGP